MHELENSNGIMTCDMSHDLHCLKQLENGYSDLHILYRPNSHLILARRSIIQE